MSALGEKLKEVLYSVLPITVIVLILHFFVTPLPTPMLLRFLLGAVAIIIGLAVFLFGVDIAITPLGNNIGGSLSRSNKIWIIIVAGLIVGFFVSIAEPDLQILAAQVDAVTAGLMGKLPILIVVSVGIAVMMVIGLIRIVYNIPLKWLLAITYAVILVLSLFVSSEFLAVAFDASGATTGALTVPFILALAVGVSQMKKNSVDSEKDSFGLVGVTSTGAILGVLAMGLITQIDGLSGSLPAYASQGDKIIEPFVKQVSHILQESAIAMIPLVVIFVFLHYRVVKFQKRQFSRILKGFIYTFIGLTLFLTGVNAGFMDVGREIGYRIASTGNTALSVGIGFVLGMVTILAEPAVYVLTRQIETVTAGSVKRKTVLIALCLGVAVAIALSVLRILVPSIQLWHYLLPGFAIAIIMSFFTPDLFVGIAFDSGGVASGPMTATFVLAFVQGAAAFMPTADVLRDAFGMIAMVAMTPLIMLQGLGLIYKAKSKRKGGEALHE